MCQQENTCNNLHVKTVIPNISYQEDNDTGDFNVKGQNEKR